MTPVPDTSGSILANEPPIIFIRQAVGETNFYAEVGLKGVTRIEVVQESAQHRRVDLPVFPCYGGGP